MVPGGSYCPGTPGRNAVVEVNGVPPLPVDGTVLNPPDDEEGNALTRLLGTEPLKLLVKEDGDARVAAWLDPREPVVGTDGEPAV